MYSPKRAVFVGEHFARLTVPQKIVSRGGNVTEDVAALFFFFEATSRKAAAVNSPEHQLGRDASINYWSPEGAASITDSIAAQIFRPLLGLGIFRRRDPRAYARGYYIPSLRDLSLRTNIDSTP
jgi:hypothetical protein